MPLPPKNRKSGYIVAIDGPSGAGKSTVSRELAKFLGGKLIDTGAMYRSVAYFALKNGASRVNQFSRIARSLRFHCDRSGRSLLVNRQRLGTRLRSDRVSQMSSRVSQYKEVRSILTRKQRELGIKLGRKLPVIVEGRDIGTVVFPNVPHKFFITASDRVRAQRRFTELRSKGEKITLKAVLASQRKRDRRDRNRRIAPLRKAPDARSIDTSHMDIRAVVGLMNKIIERQRRFTDRVASSLRSS